MDFFNEYALWLVVAPPVVVIVALNALLALMGDPRPVALA